jgi:hypothetical protein
MLGVMSGVTNVAGSGSASGTIPASSAARDPNVPGKGWAMLGWLTKRRRLGERAQRRLAVALARSEEEVVRTHVQNALDVMDAVAGELSPGRALQLYLDELEVDEPQATIVAKRVKARLEEDDVA